MSSTEVYLGLGGNIGDTCSVLQSALYHIALLKEVSNVASSSFYVTTPVGMHSQNDFVNAVCYLETNLGIKELFRNLREIEITLGKVPKPKDAPRIIDIDLLFYGAEYYFDEELEVPHPRWHERLFVIKPLADLTCQVCVPDPLTKGTRIINLIEKISAFPINPNETVSLLKLN